MYEYDTTWFAPDYKYSDAGWWNNRFELIKAYEARVKWQFLDPADRLNKEKCGFASGLLCVCAIDSLVTVMVGNKTNKEKSIKWLNNEFSDLKPHSERFLGRISQWAGPRRDD